MNAPIAPAAEGLCLLRPGAVIVDHDGGVFRLSPDGRLEPILPGGHPRPGSAHATARPPALQREERREA